MQAILAALFLFQAADFTGEGIKALEGQKYDQAVELFSKAVAADPKDYGAHFHLGLAYSFLNKDSEGIAEYKKVLELKPGLYEAELNLGILLLRQKRGGEAAPYLQQAASKKPKEFRPQFYAAEALLGAGDAVKAEEHYRAAAELDAKSAGVQLGLGRALAAQKRLEEAGACFLKAAELDPGFQDSLLELADLYEKSGKPGDAIGLYQRFPDNPAAQERMGQLLLEAKKYSEAIPVLEKAIAKDPTTPNTLALATAYLFNKDLEKAVPLLAKGVAAEPANYDVRMMYARALRDQKQYAPAAQQFYEAVKLKPEVREAWSDLAGMLYILEQYTKALAALDRSTKLGEETAGTHYFRAIILDKMKEYHPAMDSYQKFLSMSEGKFPDEEFKARQRLRVIQKELSKR